VGRVGPEKKEANNTREEEKILQGPKEGGNVNYLKGSSQWEEGRREKKGRVAGFPKGGVEAKHQKKTVP